jgi:hypothetical protein
MKPTIEIIFAEFGNVNVDVEHFRRYFPTATFKLITNRDANCINPIEMGARPNGWDEIMVVKNHDPFPSGSTRWGNRMNDYWKAKGMLDSTADVAIAFDADMRIVSGQVRTIDALALIFGVVLPANSRMLARVDATIGMDGGFIDDKSNGNGYALNCGIMAMSMHHPLAVNAVRRFCHNMIKQPARAPMVWWKTFVECGHSPCLLPQNWCVCAPDVGIGNEIVLHIGHEKVKKHYEL